MEPFAGENTAGKRTSAAKPKRRTRRTPAEMKETTGKNTSVLTPEEQAVFQRVKSQGREWETITENSVDDYSLMHDPFKLPEEVEMFETMKEFKFCWRERTSSRLDELSAAQVPNKWWVVNADTFPKLPKIMFDPVLGCISRLDQMLVFKPWWMHVKRMQIVEQLTEAQDRSGTLEGRDGEQRDGVLFSASKRNPDQALNPSESEIRAGDKIEFEETTERDSNTDLSDLVDE